MEKLEGETGKDERATRAEKAKIEEELSSIQPILEAAQKAVQSIKQDHLNEIRSLKMPPDPIHDVLSGVLRVMGNTDASWASMKKFLGQTGIVQRILNFDSRQITEEIRAPIAALRRIQPRLRHVKLVDKGGRHFRTLYRFCRSSKDP